MSDPRARLLSAWYVLAIGSVGAFHPYLAVILDRRGASGTELALCLALFPAGLLLCGPLWGLRTDRSARPQRVIGVALTAAAAGALGMLVPGSWVVLVPAMALLAMTRSPAVAVGDVLVVRLLGGGRTGEAAYGAVRSWGSVAFIGIVFAVGWLMDRWLVAPLVVHAALLLGLAALTWRLPAPAPEQRAAAGPSTSVGAVLRSPLLGLYVVSVLHIGANSLYDNLFAHHVTGLGLGARVAGVAIANGMEREEALAAAAEDHVMTLEPGLTLVQADPYGRTGKILAHAAVRAKAADLAEALTTGREQHAPEAKSRRAHLRQAEREDIDWESELPVTDPGGAGRGGR